MPAEIEEIETMKDILTINGHKFAKNDSVFTESLFNSGGTCYGYFEKINRCCIHIMDMQKNVFAAIVCNGNKFKGIVNATKAGKGTFYQHGISGKAEKLLGVPEGYGAKIEYAEKVFNML